MLLLNFLPGGFRYKRQASSNSFAMKQNLPILNNVTYPRFGAFSELVDPTVGVTHVVDLTICYDDLEHPPSIVDILGGRPICEIHFYYRIHPITEANADTIRSEQWLRDQWQLKEQVLAEHYNVMKRIKQRRSNSTRGSLSSSLRSKASYSSMSPNMSKEHLNMLGQEDHTPDSGCPQDHLATVATTTPNSDSEQGGIMINNNAHHQSAQIPNGGANGCHHQSCGELIKLSDDNSPPRVQCIVANGNGKLNHHNHLNNQISMDSNMTNSTPLSPLSPTTTDGGDQAAALTCSTTVLPFDRTKGRRVKLSWTKLLLIHFFYFAVVLVTYEVIMLAIALAKA